MHAIDQKHGRSRLARACLAVLAVLGIALAQPMPGLAQGKPAVTVSVPDTVTAPASSQTALRIAVGPAANVPRNAFVRIRGLPPMAALSEGHSIAPGAWAVALAALPDLKLTLPNTATSRSTVIVSLVTVDGGIVAEAQTTLVIAPAQPPGAAPANASILRAAPSPPIVTAAPEVATPPTLKAEDRERALRLVKRAQQLVEDSNISEARLLYEKAADLGFADAALLLASTYDSVELTRIGVRGVPADAALARRWYERAAQLGAKEAQQRLQRLGAK